MKSTSAKLLTSRRRRHGTRGAGASATPGPATGTACVASAVDGVSASAKSAADRKSISRDASHRAADGGVDCRRGRGTRRPYRPRRFRHDPRDDGGGAGAGKRRLTDEHLVEDTAERVDVGARVELGAASLFRAHVGRRPHADARLCQRAGADRARDAEVGDEGMPVGEQNVLRLDVPVNDSAAVGVVERGGNLPRDPDGFVHGDLALAIQPVAQAFALDKRHREPQVAGGFARVVQAEDVRVLEPRGQADLLLESLGSQGRGDFRMEHLQGDGPLVTEVLREEDGRKPAASELALDTILAAECVREGVANRQGCLRLSK